MDFTTNVFTLKKPSSVKIDLIGTKLPNSNDVYFRAKQEELVDQYCAARIFLQETETDDWNHWFVQDDDESKNKAFQLIFRSHFYEAALFYYNALVDISWVLCYVAIEYACKQNDVMIDLTGIRTVEEAANNLRKVESNTTSPTAENNPFVYLKIMCPASVGVIDQIIDFWNDFSSSSIRIIYNYCKHKGRPAYEEIEQLKPSKLMGIQMQMPETGEWIDVATDVNDVQFKISLEQAIADLFDFDNSTLFPYLETLIRTIEKLIEPSPMVF